MDNDMTEIRIRFKISDDMYKELQDLEDGKYTNITAYIRGITYEHLAMRIQQKEKAKAQQISELEKMYDDILG
jgi:hypothetical protein